MIDFEPHIQRLLNAMDNCSPDDALKLSQAIFNLSISSVNLNDTYPPESEDEEPRWR